MRRRVIWFVIYLLGFVVVIPVALVFTFTVSLGQVLWAVLYETDIPEPMQEVNAWRSYCSRKGRGL